MIAWSTLPIGFGLSPRSPRCSSRCCARRRAGRLGRRGDRHRPGPGHRLAVRLFGVCMALVALVALRTPAAAPVRQRGARRAAGRPGRHRGTPGPGHVPSASESRGPAPPSPAAPGSAGPRSPGPGADGGDRDDERPTGRPDRAGAAGVAHRPAPGPGRGRGPRGGRADLRPVVGPARPPSPPGCRRRGLRPGDRVGLVFGARDWSSSPWRTAGCCGPAGSRCHCPTGRRRAARPRAGPLRGHGRRARRRHRRPARPRRAPCGRAGDWPPGPGPTPTCRRYAPATSRRSSTPPAPPAGRRASAASHANLTSARRPTRAGWRWPTRSGSCTRSPIGTNAGQTMLFNALTATAGALDPARVHPGPVRPARRDARAPGRVFVVPAMAIELLDSGALRRPRPVRRAPGRVDRGARCRRRWRAELAEAFPQATIVNYYTSTEAAPAQTSMIFDPTGRDAVGRPVGGPLRDRRRGRRARCRPARPATCGCARPHPRAYYARRRRRPGHVPRRVGAHGRRRLARRRRLPLPRRPRRGRHQVRCVQGLHSARSRRRCTSTPRVAEAAVFGVPHRCSGSAVAAAVVPRPGPPPTG